MAKEALSNAGPGGAFEQLPNHVLLQIISAVDNNLRSLLIFSSRLRLQTPVLSRVCQLRPVCSRFDKLFPQVERVTWFIRFVNQAESGAIRFLQESQVLKFLCVKSLDTRIRTLLQYPLLNVLGGLTLNLEGFEIGQGGHGGDEAQVQGFFRIMARYPKLEFLLLLLRGAPFSKPLSTRYQLKRLRSMELVGVMLEDACLTSIVNVCGSLEMLFLNDVSNLKNPIICSGSLTELKILGVTQDTGYHTLHLNAPQLTRLETRHVRRFEVEALNLEIISVQHIEDFKMERVPKLTTLKLGVQKMALNGLLQVLQVATEVKSLTLGNISTSSLVVKALDKQLNSHELFFPNLEMLAVDFNKLESTSLDFCSNLCKGSKTLKVLNIGLPDNVKEKLPLVITKFLEFPKKYPLLRVTVPKSPW